MKNILFTVPFLLVFLHADLSVEKIEHMVEKIQKKRDGFDLQTLAKTKNPFLKAPEEEAPVYKAPKVAKSRMDLHAIMGNKAYINDGWKDLNSTVMGYTLKYIGKRGVVLSNGKHIKKLFLHNDKKSFITIEER